MNGGSNLLSQILFLIKKDTLKDEELQGQLEREAAYVNECGCKARLLAIGDDSFDGGKEIDKATTLIVTDSGETAKKLLDDGFYCVGYSHEENKGEDFEGAKYVFEYIENVEMDSYIKAYQRYSGEPWEIVRTKRLLIRETTIEDVDEFYKLYKDPEMTRYMEGLFEDPEDEKRYQRDYITKVYGFYGFGVWTIVRLSDNRIIGRAGFSVRNGFDEIELGFLIGKDYQRNGYAYEACEAILGFGRDVLYLDKVQTLVKEGNEVSIHLCEKLGFTEVDEVRVEENIYGRCYKAEDGVRVGEGSYGTYKKFIKTLSYI